ncbi:hypothetical protein ACUTA3_08170 [Acinetobacter baumannii]|nr:MULTISPECIES: hypothetical protein [Acinetobacter]AYX95751.1 hypothetical protein EGY13_05005 [Acinetobacter sp. FDAARGOS_493]EHU1229643.1 hypothetical protein [Acinetobacter baumannii]EHU1232971.1 hypothetical protein [Acinetobacter baumannii]EHU1245343.1 hypothetical protein [Acinetobacter baumannii]EHU1249640.1 hypothetical protein [Acinetobacter baumannii]
MWNYLVSFSTWAENNSGQIQIVIAVVALWLAILGYKKVIKQIQMAKEQEEQNYQQRNYEIKIEVINLLFKISDSIHKKLKGLYDLQTGLKNSEEDFKTKEESILLNDTLKTVQEKIDKTLEIREQLNSTLESFIKKDDIDYKLFEKKLNTLYLALIKENKETNEVDLLKAEFFIED